MHKNRFVCKCNILELQKHGSIVSCGQITCLCVYCPFHAGTIIDRNTHLVQRKNVTSSIIEVNFQGCMSEPRISLSATPYTVTTHDCKFTIYKIKGLISLDYNNFCKLTLAGGLTSAYRELYYWPLQKW